MQDGLCAAIVCAVVRVAVSVLDGLHLRGDGDHVPEHGLEQFHALGVHRGHIHALVCSGGLAGEHGQNLRPVRRRALNYDAVIVARLQFLQSGVVVHVDLRDGLGHGNRVRPVAVSGKEDAKGRRGNRSNRADKQQHHQKDAPAASGQHSTNALGKRGNCRFPGADNGSSRFFRDLPGLLRRGLCRLFRGKLPALLLDMAAGLLGCARR